MSEGLDYYVLPDDPVEALAILREAAGFASEPEGGGLTADCISCETA